MNDRAALLRAILDNPEDDLVRLVFADWLQDHGEEPFAHFIRRQVAIRAAADDALAVERIRYEFADRVPVRRDWFERPEVRRAFSNSVEDGGFLEKVAAGPEFWRRYGESLFDTDPVRSLHLLGFRGSDPLACLEPDWNRRLRGLTVAGGDLNPRAVERFAEFPAIAGLARLNFDKHPMGTRECASLVGSPYLRQLRELTLSFESGWDAGMSALVEGDWPELRVLALSAPTFSEPGLEALTRTHAFPKLEVLRLRATSTPRIDSDRDEAALLLARAPVLRGLVELDLTGHGIGDGGIEALARSPLSARLRRLILPYNRASIAGLQTVLASGNLPELRELDLSGNPLGTLDGWNPTCRIETIHLRRLKLADISMGLDSLVSLFRQPGMPPLEHLDFSGCDFLPYTLSGLSESLRSLNLGRRSLLAAQVSDYVAAIRWKSLEALNLSGCTLDGSAIRRLAESENLATLRSLDLSHNRVPRARLTWLADSSWPLLQSLRLTASHADEPTLRDILESRHRRALIALYAPGMEDSPELTQLQSDHPHRLFC